MQSIIQVVLNVTYIIQGSEMFVRMCSRPLMTSESNDLVKNVKNVKRSTTHLTRTIDHKNQGHCLINNIMVSFTLSTRLSLNCSTGYKTLSWIWQG